MRCRTGRVIRNKHLSAGRQRVLCSVCEMFSLVIVVNGTRLFAALRSEFAAGSPAWR